LTGGKHFISNDVLFNKSKPIEAIAVKRIPRFSGTLAFLFACVTPWRWAFRIQSHPSKLSFYVHRKDVNGRHIEKYGSREPLLTAWMSDRLNNSPSEGIFVDVGANLGWHAIHAAQCSSVKTVIAFEPDAFNTWLLDRNLILNGIENVVVLNCAVGAANGTAYLHRYKQSNLGRHSLLADYGFGSRVVPLLTLDSALDAIGLSGSRVLILKIDVEGYEPAVIAGAERTLARTDVVVTEWSPGLSRFGDLSTTEMFDRLTTFGFVPHTLTFDGKIDAVASNKLIGVDDQVDVVWVKAKSKTIEASAANLS
jgi:FkbM family methyltransferase